VRLPAWTRQKDLCDLIGTPKINQRRSNVNPIPKSEFRCACHAQSSDAVLLPPDRADGPPGSWPGIWRDRGSPTDLGTRLTSLEIVGRVRLGDRF
jgi:hypothetical protein